MSILGLLLGLLILCVVYWAATRIMAAFGLGDPLATVVQVAIVVLVLIWLLSLFGLIGRVPLGLR